MKRRFDIVLACLLALQPAAPLWAAGHECEMASMHATAHDAPAAKACDCCDDVDCAAPCQAVFSSPLAVLQPFELSHPLAAGAFTATDSDQIPAGHARPALRPPIAR